MNVLQIAYPRNVGSNNFKQQNRNVNFKAGEGAGFVLSAENIRKLNRAEFIGRNPNKTQLMEEAKILVADYLRRTRQNGGILRDYDKFDWMIGHMSPENFINWYTNKYLEEIKRIEARRR